MAIIDTLFITKTAKKPYPLGPHTYIAHIREYPRGFKAVEILKQNTEKPARGMDGQIEEDQKRIAPG